MSYTHRYQPLRKLPLGRPYTLRQPLVGWRRCAKFMHDPNGLLDTRSASPRAPVSIAAVGLVGILSEASSASSQKRRTSKNPIAKNIQKSCSYRQNENVPSAFKGGPEPLEKEIHKILGRNVRIDLSQLRTGPSWAIWSSGHAICEDSGSAVWKESGIMMWDSRKEP